MSKLITPTRMFKPILMLVILVFYTQSFNTYAQTNGFLGPVRVQDNVFATDQGRFQVRGVVLSGTGPNANDDLIADDNLTYMQNELLPRLKKLNVNAIRVMRVDTAKSHDKVMSLLQQNGIYVLIAIMSDTINVDRAHPTYSDRIVQRVKDVVDTFAKYDNVFGFSVGNEVIYPGNICNLIPDPLTAEKMDIAIEKSLIRDVKNYLKKNKLRQIPVGIAMVDNPSYSFGTCEKSHNLIGTEIANKYLACKSDDGGIADFIGLNSYRYKTSLPGQPTNLNAYGIPGNPTAGTLLDDIKNFSIPFIFTEMGAQNFLPGGNLPLISRDWAIIPYEYQQPGLYNFIAGEFAFMFFNTPENLGLYTMNGYNPITPLSFPASISPPNQQPPSKKVTGGVGALQKVFGQVAKIQLPMPSSKTPQRCPANSPVTVYVINYAKDPDLKVVQNSAQLQVLPAAPENNSPSKPVPVYVWSDADLYILKAIPNQAWALVCKLSQEKITNGVTITDQVAWGGDCPTQ